MKRCKNDIVQNVFETINEATLEAFLVRSDDFQPLLDLAIAALGADSLQSHVKRWLTKASQARAKKEIVQCSQIIKSIASHTSSTPTSLKQPSTSICTSNDLAARAGPPKALSSAQPMAAPASSLGPKPKPTTSMPTTSLDPRSAQEVSDPKSPSSPPASPPPAPPQTDVPRTAQPFPLEARSSPPVPQYPAVALPRSPPPRIRRPPAPSSVVQHQPPRPNPKSAQHNLQVPSSQAASPTRKGSDEIAPSHQRTSPAPPMAVDVQPAYDPLGSSEVEAAPQPFPGNSAGTPKSRDSAHQDAELLATDLPAEDRLDDSELNNPRRSGMSPFTPQPCMRSSSKSWWTSYCFNGVWFYIWRATTGGDVIPSDQRRHAELATHESPLYLTAVENTGLNPNQDLSWTNKTSEDVRGPNIQHMLPRASKVWQYVQLVQ
ncbi:hypothetical protein M407DRAFT_8858 [Tulasnella calospora MUT 4182]|uniref:Uncharacterized protein n=1 Tax=Tulasnella calospora MUT 4182 TaxID=1051891 RepID=A0A0C3KSX6_9AGAM|nr:hypothetical protein M407DRAFT_8858 [Tulasnella calospora MUT 4182]